MPHSEQYNQAKSGLSLDEQKRVDFMYNAIKSVIEMDKAIGEFTLAIMVAELADKLEIE